MMDPGMNGAMISICPWSRNEGMPKSSLKAFFNSLSIRTKLTLQILFVSICILAIATGVISYTSIKAIQEDSIKQTEAVIKLLGHDMIEILVIDDPNNAADLVSKLRAFEHLHRLFLYNESGQAIFAYTMDGNQRQPPTLIREKSSQFIDNYLYTFNPLEADGKQFGTAYIEISMEPMASSIRKVSDNLIIITLVSLWLALILASAFQQPFTQPILNLTSIIRKVTDTQNYNLRASTQFRNEFGQLYDGFNKLLDTITEANNRLFLNTERQRQIYYSITDGIITLNNAGLVDSLNHAARKLTGWKQSEATGKDIKTILQLYDGITQEPFSIPSIKAIGDNDSIEVKDLKLLSHTGETYNIEATFSHLTDRDNKTQGVLIVIRNISDEQKLKEQLIISSKQDALTGLANRAEFERELRNRINTAKDNNVYLLHAGIDHFQVINESKGHTAGDEALKTIAAVISSQCLNKYHCARIGGDEFSIIIDGQQLTEVLKFADDLNTQVAKLNFNWDGSTYPLSLSIGIAEAPSGPEALSQTLKNADTARQLAKQHGRNQYRLYQDNDETMLGHRDEMMLYTNIISALEENRMSLYFQKIAPLSPHDDKLHFEVLVRMTGADGQKLPPSLFIPVAERYRLAGRLDRCVIKNTCGYLAKHPDILNRLDSASINLSGSSLDDENLAQFVLDTLKETGIPGTQLCFEFTETSAITSLNNAKRFMQKLKKVGCRFSLDDFGTGMSSLAYLKHFPVNYLKLDGTFVRDIEHDAIDFALVRSFNDIAHTLGMQTIAEFVENDQIREKLDSIGIDHVQGYAVHKPEPLENLR